MRHQSLSAITLESTGEPVEPSSVLPTPSDDEDLPDLLSTVTDDHTANTDLSAAPPTNSDNLSSQSQGNKVTLPYLCFLS